MYHYYLKSHYISIIKISQKSLKGIKKTNFINFVFKKIFLSYKYPKKFADFIKFQINNLQNFEFLLFVNGYKQL